MTEKDLKIIIQEVVQECITEIAHREKSSIPKGKLAQLNPNIVKGGKFNSSEVSPPKKVKEYGLTSEEGTECEDSDAECDDKEENPEHKLIRGLHLITKKLLDMHQSSKKDKTKKIKVDTKVSENAKVQSRSFKTVKDGDQIPKNVRNHKVPQA